MVILPRFPLTWDFGGRKVVKTSGGKRAMNLKRINTSKLIDIIKTGHVFGTETRHARRSGKTILLQKNLRQGLAVPAKHVCFATTCPECGAAITLDFPPKAP